MPSLAVAILGALLQMLKLWFGQRLDDRGRETVQVNRTTHAEKLLELSKNAKRVNRMLKRGRTLAQIAKQMGSSKQTVGQLISIYKLPRKE